MKKGMMSVIPLLLCCIVVICACTGAAMTAAAAEISEAQEAADALYEFGLFQGTGTNAYGTPIYELKRTPNRHEAVTMLVRLLGKEKTAQASVWTTPFKDVADWAKPYVGYAYKNGITLGTSSSTYGGSADTTATQYITFMLRTLGYSSETDFQWDKAWELSDQIGMTNGQYHGGTKTFTRGDMAIISYSALFCEMKNGMTLYDHLVAEGAIADADPDALRDTGEIKTPYLTLYYDEALSDHVKVVHKTGTPYTLEFYAVLNEKPQQPLFDICFGTGSDGSLGKIKTNLGQVPVSMIMHTFNPDKNWTTDEVNTIHAMQEASNGLIEQLMAHQVQTDKKETAASDPTQIKTPYCTLQYPRQWKDYLRVEQKTSPNHSVKFYGTPSDKGSVLLFTIIFGGDQGEQVGAVKNTRGQYVSVNVVMENLENKNLSKADMTILYEMQEAVNTLIEQMPLQ